MPGSTPFVLLPRVAVTLVTLAAGCERDRGPPVTASSTATASAGPSAPSTSPAPPAATIDRPDEHGPPEPLALPIVTRICAKARCSGPLASIDVWRSKDGKIGAYVHSGDIGRCSHPPSVYFDREGGEVATIPNKPVTPGSEEAQRFARAHEQHTRGLARVETTDCEGKVRPHRAR